jgi:hypothetical protein
VGPSKLNKPIFVELTLSSHSKILLMRMTITTWGPSSNSHHHPKFNHKHKIVIDMAFAFVVDGKQSVMMNPSLPIAKMSTGAKIIARQM